MNMCSTEDFKEVSLFYMILQRWTWVTKRLYKNIYTSKVNPYVNYGLVVIMICPCRFVDYKKCSTLVQDVNIVEKLLGYMEFIGNLCTSCLISLRIKLYLLKKLKSINMEVPILNK
jgi:hypothetical protein